MNAKPSRPAPHRRVVVAGGILIGVACAANYCALAIGGSAASAASAHDHEHTPAVEQRERAAVREPTAPVRSARTETGTRSSELRAGLIEVVNELAKELRAEAIASSQRPGHDQECAQTGADCSAPEAGLSLAIFEADRRRPFAERSELALWVEHSGADAAAAVLEQTVASSSSAFERVAALLLLGSDPALQERDRSQPLPAPAYRDLALRSATEIALIAAQTRHRAALSPEAAREFVPLAASPLQGVRRASFAVLGRPEHAQELYRALAVAPLERSDLFPIAMAVSDCGLPCSDSMNLVLQQGARDARVAFYEAVSFAPDADRERLAANLRTASASVDGDERALRDRLLNEALEIEEGRP